MKVSYRLKRAFVAGQIAIVQGSNKHGRGNAMLGAIKGILLGSFKALWRYGQYDHWQNWAIDEGRPIMINLGTILAAIGIFITVRQE